MAFYKHLQGIKHHGVTYTGNAFLWDVDLTPTIWYEVIDETGESQNPFCTCTPPPRDKIKF